MKRYRVVVEFPWLLHSIEITGQAADSQQFINDVIEQLLREAKTTGTDWQFGNFVEE